VKDEFGKTTDLLLDEIPIVIGKGVMSVTSSEPITAPFEEAVLGTIGFGGAEMRGSVSLVADSTVWRSVDPAGFAADALTNAQVCDMVGELCNMLVGGFKRRLGTYGVGIVSGIPTSAYGRLSLPVLPQARELHVATHQLQTAAGVVYVRTEVLFRDGFVLPTDILLEATPPGMDLFFF